MGAPFSDITLYTPTPHSAGTPEYYEETSLQNFISDLYVRKMNGYNPPKTNRITIQSAYHTIWNRTWKNGSIIAIAPYFLYDKYKTLDKKGKYKYILDLVQVATLQLSGEYKWDRSVFEKAYQEVIESDFIFKIDYPTKISRDKKKIAKIIIEKTETITSVFVDIQVGDSIFKIKLLIKKMYGGMTVHIC